MSGNNYEFDFVFTDREQFYGVVNTLNRECGKGKWSIRGKVLKFIKNTERYAGLWNGPTKASVKKTIVIPTEKMDVVAQILFIYSPSSQ